jgi:hydrogenase nickel incorporation protein HypA/HybF
MHEWALADAIVKAIECRALEMKRNNIGYVEIIMGELQQIDEEIFLYAFNELLNILKNEKNIEVKEYKLVKEGVEFKCNRCNFTWSLKADTISSDMLEMIHFIPEVIHSFISCPNCGSHDFEITKGRGLQIKIYSSE